MATTAAWRDEPAVVVFLIGPETRHPDEAAEAEWPRRREGSKGILVLVFAAVVSQHN